MAKLLRHRDKILLTLALAGDLLEEIVPPTPREIHRAAFYGLEAGARKKSHFVKALSRAVKTGHIKRVIKDGEPYFRLTSAGKKRLTRDFPILKLNSRKWDGWWRIVFFDIEEKEKRSRERLRGKLKELGFGMIQKSVYLSPFDVAEDIYEFLESQRLSENVFVAVAEQLFAGDPKDLAEKIWGLERLNKEYKVLIDSWEKGGASHDLYLRYLEILRQDPLLPRELLPNYWQGEKARKLVKKHKFRWR